VRRRLLGLVASIVLAAFGTFVLVGYVQSAHDTAEAGPAMAKVLVVTKAIPRGTKASDLGDKVKLTDVPASSKVHDAVSDLDALTGKVASTELLPGEQVLADRFRTPEVLGREGVPKGLLEVTVSLTPDRAVGGTVRAGDTVAVISSFEPFDLSAGGDVPAGTPKKTPNSTQIILHKVLVTNVQMAEVPKDTKSSDSTDAADDKPETAPKGALLVTLALDATSVQRVVFTAEYGHLWLSAEPSDAPDGQTRVETIGSVIG
jgi:pilus assembly protein CpaB